MYRPSSSAQSSITGISSSEPSRPLITQCMAPASGVDHTFKPIYLATLRAKDTRECTRRCSFFFWRENLMNSITGFIDFQSFRFLKCAWGEEAWGCVAYMGQVTRGLHLHEGPERLRTRKKKQEGSAWYLVSKMEGVIGKKWNLIKRKKRRPIPAKKKRDSQGNKRCSHVFRHVPKR